MQKIITLFATTAMLMSVTVDALAQERLKPLPFASIKPTGWIGQQMQNDIDYGFVGKLDQLVPDLIIEDDIYHTNRLSKQVKRKDVGTHTTGDDWEVQFLWWNSETQSNWWDGYLRNVLLLNHPAGMEKAHQYVRQKLASADKDGYIGIYGRDLRYQHSTENGELWAQSSLFRGLLAYCEATGDEAVLAAVEKAVQLTMQAYPIDKSMPFKVQNAFAGVGHGLTFVDVLKTLHRLTGNNDYMDYAVFLYDDYSSHPQPEEDIQLDNLLDPDYRFKGHGVHTYEHLRALTIAAYHSNNEKYAQALAEYLDKLEAVITPSGGPIGDEWIAERHAHHSDTGYEYCSIQELLHSYSVLLHKTGESKWADKMEWLVFNAAQGARHPDGQSIAYCQTDTSVNMQGHLDMQKPQSEMRYKFSPAHQDVAVCCAPNAGRVYPYYTQNMLQQSESGLYASLYGPSKLSADIQGVPVTVEQQTDYPFSHKIKFLVTVKKPIKFDLVLRVPEWATSALVDGKPLVAKAGWITVNRQWQDQTSFELSFEDKPKVVQHDQSTAGVHYGPLLYALPLAHKMSTGRQYPLQGFVDKFYENTDSNSENYQISLDSQFTVDQGASGWEQAVTLTGQLHDPATSKEVEVELVPMGNTILRKVSFDLAPENKNQK